MLYYVLETTHPAYASVMRSSPEWALFLLNLQDRTSEDSAEAVPCRTRKLAWGPKAGTHLAGTVLKGHSSPLCGTLQLPEECTMPMCYPASHLQSAGPQQLPLPVLFLALPHLLCVVQAWCQAAALPQLPTCQPEEAQPRLFAVAAHE